MTFCPKAILVPVAIDPDDDFALAEHAVLAACDIAEKFGSHITLLHLVPMLITGGSAGMDVTGKIYQSFIQVIKSRKERQKAKLEELQHVVEERGVAVESRVVDSIESTADVILESVDELKADLLVMGSHGRSGLSRVFFGSVAEKVAQKTDIPVLLLHPIKDKKAAKK